MTQTLTIERLREERVGALKALRALYDCTIIRAPAGHKGFSQLVRWGLANRRLLARSDKCDFVITADGRAYAEVEFRRD